MTQRSIFHLISEVTCKKGVSCILIGGFAVNYYKVSRQTADVDFLITKDGFDKIISLLEKEGYKKELIQKNFAQLQSTQASLMDVDFVFVELDTLEKILKDSQKIEIANNSFLVPSLNHLIALKLHSIKHNIEFRLNRDLPDIINLIKINHLEFKGKDFIYLCKRFGTDNIYKKIVEALE